MCGIVAIAAREQPIPRDALERAALSLRHRGPDGVGLWHSADRRIGLGHTRLSIIDLTTGAQPIANEDDTRRIVANGEFYDYECIQRELTARGHRLRTQSDSEIALHLYEESGPGCLGQLRGEFAFAIWDGPNETLFAARDRFGIKPLYFAEANGSLMIASEVKALAAAGLQLRWDTESVAQSLFASLVGSRTLYHGVRQVPPGHYLLAKGGSLRLARYWDLDYPGEAGAHPQREEREWIEQLRGQVEEAVRLRLRADVPVGCLLSGGLDSSAALGVARKFTSGPLKAFTIAFDQPDFDESAVARNTAARLNADFQSIPAGNADFAAVFADAVWHAESICYNANAAARYLLSRAVRDAGIKVVLAGEGADELTAGYRFFVPALSGTEASSRWPGELLRLLGLEHPGPRLIADAAPGLMNQARSLGIPLSFVDHRAGQMAVKQGLLSPAFSQTYSGRNPFYTFFRQFDVAGQLEGREPVRQAFYLWMKSSFANYLLGGERLDMAHAVEQRLPFLDHKLFEFAREIPTSLLMRDQREKWVLREAMKPFVPEQVYRGRKQPFLAPPSILQDGSPMLALAQDRLRSASMASVPFFEHRAVVAFLDRFGSLSARERAEFDPMVLLLLSIGILHERYRL